MKKILVTGAAGFIGSHLSEALTGKKNKVIGIDNFDSYYSKKIKENNLKKLKKNNNFEFKELNILCKKEINKLFKKNSFDKVIHLAAKAGVRASIKKPRDYFQTNVIGTINLLETGRLFKIKNFTLASSSSVYGENKKIPFSEKDCLKNIISPYAASKRAMELTAESYSKIYDLNIKCLRFFTVYGPRNRPDMAINKFIKKINSRKTIQVFGEGKLKRDFTFIKDIVNGIEKASELNTSFEVINLGNNKPITVNKLIELIEDELGKKAIKELKEKPIGDVQITYADISKAKKLLNWKPKTNIKEGLKETINWFKTRV